MRAHIQTFGLWAAGDVLATLWTRAVAQGLILPAIILSGMITAVGLFGFLAVIEDRRLIPAAIVGAAVGTAIGLI